MVRSAIRSCLESLIQAREAGQLVEVGYSGFPAVVMRYEALVKAGENPFAPLPTPDYGYGFAGEDASFCYYAAKRGGCRFFVEPRVQVPHYKVVDEGGVAVTLASLVKSEPGHRAEKGE